MAICEVCLERETGSFTDGTNLKNYVCETCRKTKGHDEDRFKHLIEEIDRQGNLILSLLGQQRDLNLDIRRVAKEIGFDLDK